MKPYSSHHRRPLLYVDIAPYTVPTSSPSPPILPSPSPGHASSSSSSSSSKRTLRQPPPLTRPPLSPNPPFDSSMALTFLVLLSALFFMGFFSIYFRRFATADDSSTGMTVTRRRRQAPPPSRTPMSGRASSTGKGVDPTIIRSLPSYAYYGSAKYQIDCPVCLSEFEEAEIVKAIPYCDHVFHSTCIDRWLQSHVSCPVCRATRLLGVRSGEAEPTAADQSPTAVVAEGETSRSECLDSGQWEAVTRMMRCNSCPHPGAGLESSGARPSSLYRTLSF